MQIILESLFSMTSKMTIHELTPVAERLVPLANGKSMYFGFIPNLLGKIEGKKKTYCKLCM